MNAVFRERKALTIAGIVAVTAVLAVYIVLPLARTWSDWGDQLDPKLTQVAKLRAQVRDYEALLARRDALAKQVGSLYGRPASSDPKAAGPRGNSERPDRAAQRKPGEPNSSTPVTSAPVPTMSAHAPKEISKSEKPSGPPPSQSPAGPLPAPDLGSADRNTTASAQTPTNGKPAVTIETASAAGKRPGAPDAKDAAKSNDKPSTAQGNEKLAAYFERAASQAGVKVKRVATKKGGAGARAAKFFTPVTLQLGVEAKAENLVKLLYAIEKGDRFARIEQMDVHRDSAKGNTIEVSLDVLGYE